jgi:hypothetical protein
LYRASADSLSEPLLFDEEVKPPKNKGKQKSELKRLTTLLNSLIVVPDYEIKGILSM